MSKGDETRERILSCAVRSASQVGLEGLSIGQLATELGLSKSGLFAHFGSKEDLQIAILTTAAERFVETVLRPAFRAPRGTARLRRLFDHWLGWLSDSSVPGGCIFMAAAVELDDKEGRPRDYLVRVEKELFDTLAKSAHMAIESGDFRKNVDPEQFAFELYGIMLSLNHSKRLLRDPMAEKRARAAFEHLLAASRKNA